MRRVGAAFRAYGWREPTITFGLSQPFTAVRTLLGEGDGILRLVRRPTGGGVVDHRDDWDVRARFVRSSEIGPGSAGGDLPGRFTGASQMPFGIQEERRSCWFPARVCAVL